MRRTILLVAMVIALLGVTVPAYAYVYPYPDTPVADCDYYFPTWNDYTGEYETQQWCWIYRSASWHMVDHTVE